MRKVFFFDLTFLKEFKQEIFASDLKEIYTAFTLLMDLTRIIMKVEDIRGEDDTAKMTKAFDVIRAKVGIIVPFEKLIYAYEQVF